jgi:hypothetical protein
MDDPAGLAGLPPQSLDWADLLGTSPPRAPGEVAAGIRKSLGTGPDDRPRPAELPDTGWLRDQMELT